MWDVFYTGPKPNLFAFEQQATNLESAAALSKTKYFWYLNGLNDYSNFDFDYQPPPWEAQFTHVWPSQWQQNGGTYLAPKDLQEPQWHWHDECIVQRVLSTEIFYLDFMNEQSQQQFELLKLRWPNIKSTRYVGNHINVFNRIAKLSQCEFVWVISSICDYTNFDFTWHHAQWQEHMIHCVATGFQPRGDTFYFNPASWSAQSANLELLDWFHVINYLDNLQVSRWAYPTVEYADDNLIDAVKQHNFTAPYTLFIPKTYKDVNVCEYVPCLWGEKDKTIETFNKSNSIALIPKEVKVHLQSQLYDYPYINGEDNEDKKHYYADQPLDIVFISNGEQDAEKWYEHVSKISGRTVKWVKDIKGRSLAYKAAAAASDTDWFFAVFAKLEILSTFDFTWQPDYLQQPKHYIFHAKNVLNELEYGHMGMIAYNKRLVLDTESFGLDFTLAKHHTVVPILSGLAHFNVDPWTTWRTAFREVLKLHVFNDIAANVETTHRLKVWLNHAKGKNAEWCLLGAQDAVNYYYQNKNDMNKLLLSVEWQWLRDHAHALGRRF